MDCVLADNVCAVLSGLERIVQLLRNVPFHHIQLNLVEVQPEGRAIVPNKNVIVVLDTMGLTALWVMVDVD
jgi:hypothetical protein